MIYIAVLLAQSVSFTGLDSTITEFRIRRFGAKEQSLTISNPDGKPVKGEVVKNTGEYTEIVVRDPEPGPWQIAIANEPNTPSGLWHIWVPEILYPSGIRIKGGDSLIVRAWVVSVAPYRYRDKPTPKIEGEINPEVFVKTSKQQESYILEEEQFGTMPASDNSYQYESWIFARKIPLGRVKAGETVTLSFVFHHIPTLTDIIVLKTIQVK